jgi:hypothetical protein
LKIIDALKWSPRWTTHMGCLRSCLDYLDLDISDGWLYGGTGHAFAINLSPDLCPSGPTAWKTMELFRLGRNLGYRTDGVFGFKTQPDFHEVQKKAYAHTKDAIDAGSPCYGWELDVAEFYVVNGYDETGYYYRDMDGRTSGPKPWENLGDTGIGVVEVYSVSPGEPAEDATTVKAALEFALKHANTREYLFPNYQSGVLAYEAWIKGLQEGEASVDGTAYNAAVWAECRRNAVEFLKEAAERLDQAELFEDVVGHYRMVSEALNAVEALHPFNFPPNFETKFSDKEKASATIGHLAKARDSEKKGLERIGEIVETI